MGDSFYLYFIALALLSAVISFVKGLKVPLIKGFIFYLTLVLTIEIIGIYMADRDINNTLLYNFMSLIGFIFYSLFFYNTIQNKKFKDLILILACLFPILLVIDLFWIHGTKSFNTYFYLAGSFIVILFSVLYFLELFQHPKFVNLVREPSFWIASGVLFFYTITLSYFGIVNNVADSIKPSILKILLNGLFINITLLYLIFSIGFLCKIRITKS